MNYLSDLVDLAHKLGIGTDIIEGIKVSIAIVLGGVLGFYIRFLYMRYNHSVSNTEQFGWLFPMLTMITVCVIAVVKSSLALSLGLVGALSIVRFRAAIKDPEELVYLFLCIAVGLSLGAGQVIYAVALVVILTLFLQIRSAGFMNKSSGTNLLITVTGNESTKFTDPANGALANVSEVIDVHTVQRFEVESGRGLLRLFAKNVATDDISGLMAELQKRMPEYEISYLDLNTMM